MNNQSIQKTDPEFPQDVCSSGDDGGLCRFRSFLRNKVYINSWHGLELSLMKLITLALYSLFFVTCLYSCNPEPGPLHFVKMPPALTEPFFWVAHDARNGFVNDYVRSIRSVKLTDELAVMVGTKENGVYLYKPSYGTVSFDDWEKIAEPKFEGKSLPCNDMEYWDGKLLIATPVGLYLDDVPLSLDSSTETNDFKGLIKLTDEILAITEKEILRITSDGDVEAKLPFERQPITFWDYIDGLVYVSTPTEIYSFSDFSTSNEADRIRNDWTGGVMKIGDIHFLGGVKGLIKSEKDRLEDVSGDLSGKWIRSLAGKPGFSFRYREAHCRDIPEDEVNRTFDQLEKDKKFYRFLTREMYDHLYENTGPPSLQIPESQRRPYKLIMEQYWKMYDRAMELYARISRFEGNVHETVWAGTRNNGVYYYHEGKNLWENINSNNSSFRGNNVSRIYCRPEYRLLWCSIDEDALYQEISYDLMSGKKGNNNGASGEPVLFESGDFSTVKVRKRVLAALEKTKGVLLCDLEKQTRQYLNHSTTSKMLPERINDVEVDGNGDLWIATASGLFKKGSRGWEVFTPESGISSNHVEMITWLDDKKTLVTSCALSSPGLGKKISVYNGNFWENYSKSAFISRLSPGPLYSKVSAPGFRYDLSDQTKVDVRSMFITENDDILVGTERGLWIFLEGQWRPVSSASVALDQCLLADLGRLPSGKLLIGTDSGLFTHDGKNFGALSANIPVFNCIDFEKDDLNPAYLWIAGNFGPGIGTLVSYMESSGSFSIKPFKMNIRKLACEDPYLFMAGGSGIYFIRKRP